MKIGRHCLGPADARRIFDRSGRRSCRATRCLFRASRPIMTAADVIAFLASGGAQPAAATAQPSSAPPAAALLRTAGSAGDQAHPAPAVSYIPDARYTLRTGIAEGRMVLSRRRRRDRRQGQSGPDRRRGTGRATHADQWRRRRTRHRVSRPEREIAARYRQRGQHDDRLPCRQVRRLHLFLQRARSSTGGHARSVPGHAAAAARRRWSRPISRESPPTCRRRSASASHRPCGSICSRVELEGRLAEGTTFGYWTFNGKVPGPFVRVRVGDTVDVHLKNSADSIDDPLGRFSCRDRSRRRRGRAAGRSRPGKIDDVRRRLCRAFMSITARRRWSPNTLPTACMD